MTTFPFSYLCLKGVENLNIHISIIRYKLQIFPNFTLNIGNTSYHQKFKLQSDNLEYNFVSQGYLKFDIWLIEFKMVDHCQKTKKETFLTCEFKGPFLTELPSTLFVYMSF